MFRIARVGVFAALRATGPVRRALNLPSSKAAPLSPATGDGVSVREVDCAENFTRPMPRLFGEAVPPWQISHALSGVCPATFVVEIQNGRFWSFYGGTVTTCDGRIIHEVSKDVWGPRLHTAYTRAALPKPRRLSGRTLSLVTPEAAGNYHHWMIDCVSRAGLAQRAGYELSDFDQVLVKHRERAFQLDSLKRLGFSPSQLLRVGENDFFETDTLVVPSVRHDNKVINRADVQFVRGLYLPDEPSPAIASRRLYVGRRDAAFRRVSNEHECLPILREHGFEEVAMSRMSVGEQARVFSEAEIIVGPNGSALANLVFANPACRVIECLAPGWIVPYNWMIGANLGLDYTMLIGAGTRSAPGELPRDVKQDVEIDIRQFKSAIEAALRGPTHSSRR